uniref:Groucho/TLE N-terminal Q-rich domain-containing protein n=1 Tax=Bubo bubo TaxID=30461 RepID=A0A8C0F3Q8_BUBBB
MSYGLNIEMHKQAEIVKRLSAICAQIIPFLTQEVRGEAGDARWTEASFEPLGKGRTCVQPEPREVRGTPSRNCVSHGPVARVFKSREPYCLWGAL